MAASWLGRLAGDVGQRRTFIQPFFAAAPQESEAPDQGATGREGPHFAASSCPGLIWEAIDFYSSPDSRPGDAASGPHESRDALPLTAPGPAAHAGADRVVHDAPGWQAQVIRRRVELCPHVGRRSMNRHPP